MLEDAEEQQGVGTACALFGMLQVLCHGRGIGAGEQTLLLGRVICHLRCVPWLVGALQPPGQGVMSRAKS